MFLEAFATHNHSHISNIRLLDSINKIKDLIDRSIELGLKGIALTDHEALSGHVEFLKYYQDIKKKKPDLDFKISLGNEIYLIEKREMKQKYFHFILLAKNADGHRALRELSSTAWYNSYFDRGMERVPTLKTELREIVSRFPNSLVATTACLGGELPFLVRELIQAETNPEFSNRIIETKTKISNFFTDMKAMFGSDFYVEVAPGLSKDQVEFNKRVMVIAKAFDVKIIVATDAHYLKKEDSFVHSTYLNAQNGDREVKDFYEYCYLMSGEEIHELLSKSVGEEKSLEFIANTMEIRDKIEDYNLFRSPIIPKEDVKDYPVSVVNEKKYPNLNTMLTSDSIQNRYWGNQCMEALIEKNLLNDEYLSRVDYEADIILHISKNLNQDLTAYFNSFQSYIDTFWEAGSIVGPGRGSSVGFLSNFLLGITQLDPIKYNLPAFRFLNKDRVELPDIDIDLAPSKRPSVFKKLRSRKTEIQVLQVATFGTEGTKSTILTGCRGYRSEEYPEGIDVDTAQYLTSLIPSYRGFLWPLSDVINGNPEEDRKPIKEFVETASGFDGLINIMLSIEGLINKRSTHASGVIIYNDSPFETTAFMRAPSGDLITQFPLHDSEMLGDTKFDFLVTEVSDKIIEAVKFLQKDSFLPKDESLRSIYNKYLHPESIDLSDGRLWDALASNSVLDAFQFNTPVGAMAAKIVKPRTVGEMSASNALMRLMAEKGEESPLDKYARFKNDPSLWEDEMNVYGLTEDEKEAIRVYYEKDYGVPPYQESLMLSLMDKNICGFALKDSNYARKIVAKKQMSEIPALKTKILETAKSIQIGKYIWDTCVSPQLGYSFSELHSLAYSFVGVQTLYLATNFPAVYWNTACLVVDAGINDIEETEAELEEELIDDEDPLDFMDDNEEEVTEDELVRNLSKAKVRSTDYGKLAKAMNNIISKNIKISKPSINNSSFNFRPDSVNDQILFGLSCIANLGKKVVDEIIEKRPYSSLPDFLTKVKINKTAVINLIKSGAMDELYPDSERRVIMGSYIAKKANLKKNLTLQNLAGLINAGLIPEELAFEVRVYNYTKILRKHFKDGLDYDLSNESVLSFYVENFDTKWWSPNKIKPAIDQKVYDKRIYQPSMDKIRAWLKANLDTTLKTYNKILFNEIWNKDAAGSISAWEMSSISFYYHEHELLNIDKAFYDIKDFGSLPEEPLVDYFFKKNNTKIPVFCLDLIVGTVISKDKTRSSITILTPDGNVVTVKFRKEYFALYDKQISEKQEDGKRKIVDKSWFKKGNKVMLTGYRRDDQFVPKTYARTQTRTLYLITNIDKEGRLSLRSER